MRKSLLVCGLPVLCFLAAITLNAYRGGTGPGEELKARREEMHRKRIEELTKLLSLTKEQAQKISEITENGWIRLEEERRQMMERAKNIRDAVDTDIEKILTPEQLEKFKTHKEEMGEKREKLFQKHKKSRKKHGAKYPPMDLGPGCPAGE